MYRPPLTPSWKGISGFILWFVVIIALCMLGSIFYQDNERDIARKSDASGILIEKKDLHRGDFLLVIAEKSKTKEYVLSGFDIFYAKFYVGDSLTKKNDSFQFKIFRRDSSQNYRYVETVGYD